MGTGVTISGTNLAGASTVVFNDVVQPYFSVDATGTYLTTTVPAGATSGPIWVMTPYGTGSSVDSFIVTASRHLRGLTFGLWGHLIAGGYLTTTDAFPGCYQGATVKIQRHGRWRWNTVVTALTDTDGRYHLHVWDRSRQATTLAKVTEVNPWERRRLRRRRSRTGEMAPPRVETSNRPARARCSMGRVGCVSRRRELLREEHVSTARLSWLGWAHPVSGCKSAVRTLR